MEFLPPEITDAPGLVWKKRKVGYEAQWHASPDIVATGFEPATAFIWTGADLTDHGRLFIRLRCNARQADMNAWAEAHKPKPAKFDGTLHTLVWCYQTDEASDYHGLSYVSKLNTNTLCRRLIEDRGSELIADIKHRNLKLWHKEWLGENPERPKLTMAHQLIGQLRTLVGFGTKILEDAECLRLSVVLSQMRFTNAKPRSTWMTVDQIAAIIKEANRQGLYSIALAQVMAFGCTFRQKDCIGEYVPITEPGADDLIVGNLKHIKGLRFETIDSDFKLHHIQSKRKKLVEPPLLAEPMIVEQFNLLWPSCVTRDGDKLVPHRELLPASGRMIVSELTGVPWTAVAFRRKWREIATAVGVPLKTWQMDTRASAVTEATNSNVSLEIVAKAAGHSNTSQTAAYSRDQSEKHGLSMRARAEAREAAQAEAQQ